MKGLRVIRIVRQHNHLALLDLHLHGGFEQACGEAGIVSGQHLTRPRGACGDAPVTRRSVVHRVVKARGRNIALRAGQCFAQGVAVVPVAGGGSKHTGQIGRVGARMLHRFGADRQRQFDDTAGTPALGGRQHIRCRQHGGCWLVRGFATQTGRALRPIRKPGSQNAQAPQAHPQNMGSVRTGIGVHGCGIHARPSARLWSKPQLSSRLKSRLQLLPPKPNELLSTCRTACCRGCKA